MSPLRQKSTEYLFGFGPVVPIPLSDAWACDPDLSHPTCPTLGPCFWVDDDDFQLAFRSSAANHTASVVSLRGDVDSAIIRQCFCVKSPHEGTSLFWPP